MEIEEVVKHIYFIEKVNRGRLLQIKKKIIEFITKDDKKLTAIEAELKRGRKGKRNGIKKVGKKGGKKMN